MSIKTTITNNSITSAVVGGKTLTRRTEGGQVIYDGFIDTGGGGGGGGMTGEYILDIPNYQSFTYQRASVGPDWTIGASSTGPVMMISEAGQIGTNNNWGLTGMLVEHNLNSDFLDAKLWLNGTDIFGRASGNVLVTNGNFGNDDGLPDINSEGLHLTSLDKNKVVVWVIASPRSLKIPCNGVLSAEKGTIRYGYGSNITTAKLIINSYT